MQVSISQWFMIMAAISGRMPSVDLEFDAGGRRIRRQFDDAFEARRVYARLLKAGRNPRVHKPAGESAEVPTKVRSRALAKVRQTPSDHGRDDFGARQSTQAARINASIGTTPCGLDAIVARSKLSAARVRSHLNHLLREKLIVRTDKGYARKHASDSVGK
jgi:hypothetical protein